MEQQLRLPEFLLLFRGFVYLDAPFVVEPYCIVSAIIMLESLLSLIADCAQCRGCLRPSEIVVS